MRLGLVLSLFALLLACGGTDPGPTASGSTTEPLALDPSESDPSEPRVEPAYAALDAESRDAVGRSPVPVLLLPERYAADARVMVGPRWLAIAYSKDGLTLSLHATDAAVNALSEEELRRVLPAEQRVRGVPARTTVNDGIRAVTWEHEGVAYSLEVECADVLDDARCAAPTFALSLADELVALPQTFERGARRVGGVR
jgi:hypothetical protein